jgi:hypothetical protein
MTSRLRGSIASSVQTRTCCPQLSTSACDYRAPLKPSTRVASQSRIVVK